MNPTTHQVLSAFDALPEGEKHEVAAAVLKRVLETLPDDVSEESLVELAEDMFLDLDAREDSSGES